MFTLRIFLSSPGDCTAERAIVHEITSHLNIDPLVSSFARVKVVAWDWGAGIPLEALATPQESVNRHLALPEDCEVFIGIFQCKIGTALPTNAFWKNDGKPFHSGSEYEFHRAWNARRRGASRPAIYIYRKKMSENSCPDSVQHKELQHFFEQQPFKNGNQWTGSLNNYRDPADFSSKLEGHLRLLLSQYQPGVVQPFENWLKHQATILTADAGPRYTGDAHIENGICKVFDWLLVRKNAIATLDKSLSDVWESIYRDAAFADDRKKMEFIAEIMRNDVCWHDTPDFSFIIETLQCIENKAWSEKTVHDNKANVHDKKNDEEHAYRSHRLKRLAFNARDSVDLLKRYAGIVSKRILLLVGPAGQGKTHTLVDEINRTLNSGGIAIGVLGQTLGSGGDLWSAICSKLGWQNTTGHLLDKLENEAANKNQRALIVIDALNETPKPNRWRTELSGMIREISSRPHLALVISVRTDYLNYVLPEIPEGKDLPWVKQEHPGFAGLEPDALMRYFEYFGVKAPVAPPLGEFSNPLYVQLLAKSLKNKQFKHWLPSWLEVWKAWMERLEQEALDKAILSDASRSSPVQRTMNRLAQAMLDDGLFLLPRQQADDIARQTTGNEMVISFLCSAGALIDRVNDDEEVVEFGFERLSDTFFADRLLDNIFKGLSSQQEKLEAMSAALAHDGMLFPLISKEWMEHPLYYRRSGLLEALCLAVPQHVGAEFPSLIPEDQDQSDITLWELNNAFTNSLRWRNKSEEFGTDSRSLFEMWYERVGSNWLDELIRFALIPGHPLAMEYIIRLKLLEQENPGARDARWSVEIARMWSDEWMLFQLVKWARDSYLHDIYEEVALPAAQMLAWACATSNNLLRHAAIKGLTRLLAACPSVLKNFLPDFLSVNDPFILEGVMVAVWGVLLDGADSENGAWAAQQVCESQFPGGNARWCHITLRHYARCIVEEAQHRGWLNGIDLSVVRPPYQSHLQLEQVPSVSAMEAMDSSRGFGIILGTARKWSDFYRYIMGGNSASLEFSSTPLSGSSEAPRPFGTSEPMLAHRPLNDVFDLALAARFVSWNCRSLGWTAERFESFDTELYNIQHGRSDGEGRTERIGKKYQWISWHTLLAFLSDNYAMQSCWNDESCSYDTPDQVGVHLQDPARWLRFSAPERNISKDEFWRIPSLPQWPQPNFADMTEWLNSGSCDLPPSDIVACIPAVPLEWGDGALLRVACEHIWKNRYAPGQWGLGNKYHADIWWQITPLLIYTSDLPKLLQEINKSDVLARMTELGRVTPANDWHIPITQWSALQADWDNGFRIPIADNWEGWLPVPWREFVGECGHPDQRDDHAPIKLPLPSLFQEWGLKLDLRRGAVCYQDQVLFGLSGWVHGEDALFAKLDVLQQVLAASKYTLVWRFCGERRAFLNISDPHSNSVWADYNGLAYLCENGQVQTIWLKKVIER